MAKRMRRVAAVLPACALLLSLCACNPDLDALRKETGYVVGIDLVMQDGTVYKPVEEYYLDPPMSEERVYITENKDVPLLLASLEGRLFEKSNDGIFLKEVFESNVNAVYVREDHYDQVLKTCNLGAHITTYRYAYTNVSGMETVNTILPAEQGAALESLQEKLEWERTTDSSAYLYDMLEKYYRSDDYGFIKLQACSENGWFICDDECWMTWDKEKENFLWVDNDPLSMYTLFYYTKIPPEDVATVKEIFKPLLESDEWISAY